MNSRVNLLLVSAAILLAVLVPVVFVSAVLLLIAPTLLVAHRTTFEVSVRQPLALRTLPLFRAPPARRV